MKANSVPVIVYETAKAIISMVNNASKPEVGGLSGLKESLDNYLNAEIDTLASDGAKLELNFKIREVLADLLPKENELVSSSIDVALSLVKVSLMISRKELSPEDGAEYLAHIIIHNSGALAAKSMDEAIIILEEYKDKAPKCITLVIAAILLYVNADVKEQIVEGIKKLEEPLQKKLEALIGRIQGTPQGVHSKNQTKANQ